jgi:hypothetical protein
LDHARILTTENTEKIDRDGFPVFLCASCGWF